MISKVDLDDDDLRAHPDRYPGTPVPADGVLDGAAFVPMTADGVFAEFPGRHAVLAVGSNACAAVIRRKLSGVGTPVGFVRCVVDGVAAGFSAHRSVAGFVPAAPFADPAVRAEVVVNLVDDEQLACLDATEPNYVRDSVELSLGSRTTRVHRYRSRWGVIAAPGQRPIPLCDQPALEGLLRGHVTGEPLSAALATEGWARSDGLGGADLEVRAHPAE
ncbi:hypothetical protein [Williamsia sterculiae]|uniref:Uncharacterized protein n=1 Tax=Williamsia sterculiae TaxID=1344003 RepID=A0A1N7HC96_9NOCA|nr:hypothetical protein [Williamsia sterculiae]SIS22485.1 hypothetical protein SAMN05445060_3960 [Williamsia sterculiae]